MHGVGMDQVFWPSRAASRSVETATAPVSESPKGGALRAKNREDRRRRSARSAHFGATASSTIVLVRMVARVGKEAGLVRRIIELVGSRDDIVEDEGRMKPAPVPTRPTRFLLGRRAGHLHCVRFPGY
jgi:hypothetical protein